MSAATAAAGPSTAAAIVSVAAVAVGVVAANMVQPEKVIDYTINKTSNAVTALDYKLRDGAEGNPRRDFLRSSLRGLSKFVDENALALEWKVRVMDFDEKSPISSQWIVRGIVGLAAFWITRRGVMAAAMR